VAATGFLAMAGSPLAYAADPADVANRLKTSLAEQGIAIEWTVVDGTDAVMVMHGVSAKAAGEDDRLPIGDITLSDIREENGGYLIGTASMPKYSATEDDVTVELDGIRISDLSLPAEGSSDIIA